MKMKLFGVAVLAAALGTALPAHAAKVGGGCSGSNLEKTETAIEAMADGDAKFAAEKEVALAQDALLSGKMGVCAVHLSKAAHVGVAK
ncbi:conserved exported hypothetical protein [Bradyrhizobium sp. STM 3843]|uniref:hypothetical protein n=1 Tax=Bradyrhizobium sp. STM 3843 TaxID=551947 RepID=UPI00024076D7|nr:hypothetical protein [Bradyrhizobium sp. STM 3843]CCE07076.1 conserved exported hypothetical protein [Bradyrhizobium sp. STM 3843]